MCGLAGIVAWDERYRVEPDVLAAMGKAVAHRGPDGQAVWISHSQSITPQSPHCGLAFARLAILDLDARAMQPMTDGVRYLVFNGEIYNFRELRRELESIDPSYAWKTTGDSEVILRAFDAWGEACLPRFNGMFAFAIWDAPAHRLFLARDRMGQKPMYVAIAPDGGAVAFASELGALRPLNWPDRSINRLALGQYLQTGYIAAPATIHSGIGKLPAASGMICQSDENGPRHRFSSRSWSYFDPNLPGQSTAGPADVRALVTQAVRRQLIADVPVGCFLSGGIDSSVIAAAIRAAAGPGQPILTFCVGFEDARYDETPYAAEVSAHLHTEHRQFIVRPDAAEDLPKLAAVYGEPFGDSSALPTHYLSRETRQFVKVALSGDGGDELFAGYDRYRAVRWAARFARAGTVFGLSARAARALPGSHPKSTSARIKRFANSLHLEAPRRYARYMDLFEPDHLRLIGWTETPEHAVERAWRELSAGRDAMLTAMAVDRVTYLPEDLLTKVDRASMLHALEVRSPFMDPDLVCAAALPAAELHGAPKRLLRAAFGADLPARVFQRRKMGFAVPIGQWLRTSLRDMLHDLLFSHESLAGQLFDTAGVQTLIDQHQNQRADHSQRLYGLLMLELWWRTQRA